MILYAATLPIELRNGNAGRGSKWFSSAKVRKDIESRLRVHSFGRPKAIPFPPGVTLTLTRVVGPGGKLWDSDSIGRGNAKELLDALVSLGWFVDDGPKWIVETRYRQVVDRERGPCVDVVVEL